MTGNPGHERGLGVEEPMWDSLQVVLTFLFLAALVADGLSQLFLDHSTMIINVGSAPVLLLPAFISISMDAYLVRESHTRTHLMYTRVWTP